MSTSHNASSKVLNGVFGNNKKMQATGSAAVNYLLKTSDTRSKAYLKNIVDIVAINKGSGLLVVTRKHEIKSVCIQLDATFGQEVMKQIANEYGSPTVSMKDNCLKWSDENTGLQVYMGGEKVYLYYLVNRQPRTSSNFSLHKFSSELTAYVTRSVSSIQHHFTHTTSAPAKATQMKTSY